MITVTMKLVDNTTQIESHWASESFSQINELPCADVAFRRDSQFGRAGPQTEGETNGDWNVAGAGDVLATCHSTVASAVPTLYCQRT